VLNTVRLRWHIERAKARNETRRTRAVVALGDLGDARAIPILIEAFAYSNPAFRQAVIEALRKLAPASVEALMQTLSDGRWFRRTDAVEALGELADARAVEPLLEILNRRWTTAGPAWPHPLCTCARCAKAAVGALVKLGDPRAVEGFIGALVHDDKEVRRAAAQALAYAGEPAWREATLGQDDDCDRVVGLAAPDVDRLVQATRGTGYVHAYGVHVIMRLPHERAVTLLIEAVRLSSYSKVRETAARALGDLGDLRAVDPLIERYLQPGFGPWDELCAVVEALGKLGDPRAVEALTTEISLHNDWTGRHLVIEALAKIGDPRAIEPLIGTLYTRNAGDALVRFGSAAIEPLIRALQGRDLWRSKAAEPLGALSGPRAIEALTAALHDCDITVRGAAAHALGMAANTENSARHENNPRIV
jgi:HEAT repeat protein